MKLTIPKFAISLLCLYCLVLTAMPISAQRRTATKKTATATKTTQSKTADEKVSTEGLIAPEKSESFSGAYETGELPTPSSLAAGTPEQQAATLAEAITLGDANSMASLMAAIKAAGYGIRDKSENVDYDPAAFQGLALDAWQIALIAKLYGDGWGVGLGRFGDSLARVSPEWKKETNVQDLVESIRAAAESDKPGTRFWGTLIIELGLNADEPYDLRLDEGVAKARLDAIQVSFILTRLGADLNYAATRNNRRADAIEKYQRTLRGNEPRRIGASDVGEPSATSQTDAQQLPCTKSELEQLILDLQASGNGIIFGKFLEHLEGKEIISKTPGQLLGAANAALILLKLIMTYAALEADIKMDGDMLTRTKTTVDGERRGLSAQVRLDIGKWQVVNCLRATANMSGVDFSLPGDGPIGGVRVDWNLLAGGRTLENIRQVRQGNNVASDQIVYLDTQSTALPEDRGKHYNYTDKDGVSKIFAVGKGQPTDLSGKSTRPVMKTMTVDLDIQVKTMKVKDATTGVGTANDLAGNAIAFLTGDFLGGIAGTAAETIYRSNMGSSRAVSFPVKDWIPCDGGWRGTVTYQRVLFNRVRNESSTKNTTIRRDFFIEKDLYSAKINISPGDKAEIMKAVAQITYKRNMYNYYFVSNESTCGNRGRRARWSQTSIKNESWNGSLSTEAQVVLSYYNGNYSLGVTFPPLDVEFNSSFNTTYAGGCGTPKPPNSGQDKRTLQERETGNHVADMKYDPKTPHVLRGSHLIKDKDGRGLLITWDLARCM